MLLTPILIFYCLLLSIVCNDINSKDFHLFSKKMCKTGCSKMTCFPNTLISIDSIEKLRSSDDSSCGSSYSRFSAQEYNCHFKFIENHIFKTCSNSYSCQICPDKIESKMLDQNTFCTSEFDFKINYRCIPGLIKNDNICAHSYLDLSCFDRMYEKLVIINATISSQIKDPSDDSRECTDDNKAQLRTQIECQQLDKTNEAIFQCSNRDKCSIGPNGFTPNQCGNMHMKISYACVPSQALNFFNKKMKEPMRNVFTRQSPEIEDEHPSWFSKQKWKILGISSSIMVVVSLSVSLLCFFIRRKREKHNCQMNIPKENLFNKLGQKKFSPPPSSIDKVNMEFDNESLGAHEMYNCNSDNEDPNTRSIYSSNVPCSLAYMSPFYMPPPTINTCQYFTPLISPGHVNMLEMPPIHQASSGNLTSSTTNSSHGTPRGTKSSGIFSMNDASFEISHHV